MEKLNQAGTTPRALRLATLLLVSLAVLASAACGPRVIKDRPPFVSISSMNLENGLLSTTFDIANQNGVPLEINSTEITVTVNTSELTRYDSQDMLAIDANSTEKVMARHAPDDFTQKLLVSLDSGELDSLSIELSGRVRTVDSGTLRFEQKGYLYRVPGRPGQFRAAVTQADELVREEPRYRRNR